MDTKLAYTIEEAIEAGAGSRTVVYEAIKARTLKARKRGKRTIILSEDLSSPLKKALLTGFHSTAKHNATKAVSPSSETMRTI